jgi:hypothetical protein
VVAVVVLGHSTPHTVGNPVAASSKQVPARSVATTHAGTGSTGSAGTTKNVTPTSSLATRKGNARVSTRAARSAGPSNGGSGGGSAAPSPSIDPASAVSPAVDLPVPAHFGPLLRQAWARGVGIKAPDILSTVVGSVFYAEQPAAHTYWAISQFVPSALADSRGKTLAGVALLAEFHGTAEFEKVPGHHWAYVGSFSTGACPGALPVPVLTTWGLCTVGS